MKNIIAYSLCLVLVSSTYAKPIVVRAHISISPERDPRARAELIKEIVKRPIAIELVSKKLKMNPRAISPVCAEPLAKTFLEVNMRAEAKDRIDQLHTALEMLDPISSIAKKAADSTKQRRDFYLKAQDNARELIMQNLSFIETFLTQSTLPDFREVLFYAYKINKEYIEKNSNIKQQLLNFYSGSDIEGIISKWKEDIEREGGY